MLDILISHTAAEAAEASPLYIITEDAWPAFAVDQPASVQATAKLAGFSGRVGEVVLIPSATGAVGQGLFGVGAAAGSATVCRGLSARLPPGTYRIEHGSPPSADRRFDDAMALAWLLGTYGFDRYKRERGKPEPRLVAPAGVDIARARAIASACFLARDMVNTPASDMGPLQIETIAREIAEAYGASFSAIAGEALIEAGYPAVYAVGRAAAADRSPRMIELSWGRADHPLVAVVGKGVTFDTGGLDMKPSSAMRLMKKDMGGAAHALALARMIMALDLPVRLAVLIPAVENAISGGAMRPGDVLSSRKGLSIEVGNTDAEGRLILADALERAAELRPDLTVDLATLTGAARVALGPQVIPFYTDDESIAAELTAAARDVDDPLWRMPLWAGYEAAIDSDVADIRNDSDGWAQAGSITAALFLKRFAPTGPWVHFDIYAWNPKARPGWPVGGEAQAIRAILAALETRYA